MSARRLGGGRVLGSGKGLAPPPPAHAPRSASPFAPQSDSSTVSLRSRNSTPISLSPSSSSPLPDFSQDLTSNVTVGGSSSNGASSGNKLACPICEEEMVTLLQLNRHLDDVHQELPEAEQDEVKSWFDKQVLKAKRFQPLSLINQKLRGLDVFESNETQPISAGVVPGRPAETVIDPEELVTRKHWQRPTGMDVCTDPLCDRRLGPLGGSVNCRKCGRLFCEVHTMYQMKLSRSANHEPVRGVWCRVCETCYKSREGYNDHTGLSRDHTAAFAAIRTKKVERQRLEVQRLEKRLTKLTRLLVEAPPETGVNSGLLSPLAGQRSQRKAIEQSVVTWEDDAAVPKCPFCKQEFGSWTFRRHHCRICGRVVCADPQTNCSSEVGLNVANPNAIPTTEKTITPADGQVSIDVRMCCECKHTIFSHRDFVESISHRPPDQRAYETLRQFERGIQMLLPSFHKSLQALQPPEEDPNGPVKPPPTHAQIQEAAKIRKRLTDAFAKYDLAAKRIRNMKTDSPTQLRLQKAIYASASAFLHANLIPLKSVPAMLKSQSSNHRRLLSSGNGSSHSISSPLRNGESARFDPETSSLGGASEVSTAVSALETEEKEAREKLVVLEEQRFMVQEMLNHARGARRFEEAGALTKNLEELDKEIEASKRLVAGVEERWEGLYAGT
ncbi:FYVE zinc finger-domain-containing protein [Corynascus similis CBS 632.67]